MTLDAVGVVLRVDLRFYSHAIVLLQPHRCINYLLNSTVQTRPLPLWANFAQRDNHPASEFEGVRGLRQNASSLVVAA